MEEIQFLKQQIAHMQEQLAPLLELHPFTQERLNDLEIEFRRYAADHSEERAAKIEDRLAKLENRPKLSIEDVDLRITAL
jgi:polyhydroxyalkanoate synthesis regulator phasin